MKAKTIQTPEGPIRVTFNTHQKSAMPPRWVRRIGLVIFSPLVFAIYLGYISEKKNNVSFSVRDFINGYKVFWNL